MALPPGDPLLILKDTVIPTLTLELFCVNDGVLKLILELLLFLLQDQYILDTILKELVPFFLLLLLALVDAVDPFVPVLLDVLLAVALLQLDLPVPLLFQSQLLLPVASYLFLIHLLYFFHLLVPWAD